MDAATGGIEQMHKPEDVTSMHGAMDVDMEIPGDGNEFFVIFTVQEK